MSCKVGGSVTSSNIWEHAPKCLCIQCLSCWVSLSPVLDLWPNVTCMTFSNGRRRRIMTLTSATNDSDIPTFGGAIVFGGRGSDNWTCNQHRNSTDYHNSSLQRQLETTLAVCLTTNMRTSLTSGLGTTHRERPMFISQYWIRELLRLLVFQ